jgi:hypothetical protein
MDADVDVKRIRKLIQTAEVKAAKAQGVMDNLEKKWKEDFGKGTAAAATEALEAMKAKAEKQEKRRKELIADLDALYDWDSLED